MISLSALLIIFAASSLPIAYLLILRHFIENDGTPSSDAHLTAHDSSESNEAIYAPIHGSAVASH